MQEIIVWFIVLIAAGYIAIRFYRNFSGRDKGCCGECQSCSQKTTICQSTDDGLCPKTTPPSSDTEQL